MGWGWGTPCQALFPPFDGQIGVVLHCIAVAPLGLPSASPLPKQCRMAGVGFGFEWGGDCNYELIVCGIVKVVWGSKGSLG